MARQLYRFVGGPAALGPIGGRDADEQREMGRPFGADSLNDLKQKADAIGEAAAVRVGAVVGKGRQKFVKQIAVGCVNLNKVEARGIRAACGP